MWKFGMKSAVLALVLAAVAGCSTLNAAPTDPAGQSSIQQPFAQRGHNHGW